MVQIPLNDEIRMARKQMFTVNFSVFTDERTCFYIHALMHTPKHTHKHTHTYITVIIYHQTKPDTPTQTATHTPTHTHTQYCHVTSHTLSPGKLAILLMAHREESEV